VIAGARGNDAERGRHLGADNGRINAGRRHHRPSAVGHRREYPRVTSLKPETLLIRQ
jgi:hypothetical protein